MNAIAKKMALILTTFLCLFISNGSFNPAYAEMIQITSGEDRFWAYLNTDTIEQISDTNYTVWIKSVLNPKNPRIKQEIIAEAKEHVAKYGEVNPLIDDDAYELTLHEYDLKRKRVRYLTMIAYASTGETIPELGFSEPSDWHYVAPGSVGEAKLDALRDYLPKTTSNQVPSQK